MDNLIEIAQPEATYTVNYLDRYGANTGMEFGASDMTQGLDYPDVTIDYAVHLVDPEIDINIWAFIDKLRKCYDKPWNTSLTINTNLSTMTQHTFTDVLAHIADVASQLKGKASTYERAGFISADGTLAAERLQGAIDAAKIKIFGGGSTWYTDESGNMVFESADGSSAMTLAGGGFALADSKNEWGEWNWRSFGSGHGFSADELITGFLSADRIQANSIGSHKLDSNTQALLGWVEGSRMEFGDESITATVAKELSTGDSDAAVQYRAAMAKLTAEDYTIYFEEKSAELDKKIAAMQKTTDYINNWYQFKSDGFYIRGKQADGSASPMYTQQTNSSYTFYNDGEKVASMSVNGFSAPKVEAESEFRLGNLVAIVDDNNDITWVYSKKSTTN